MKIFYIFFSFFVFISCLKKEEKLSFNIFNNKSFKQRFIYYSKHFLGRKYPKKDPVKDKYYDLNEMNCITYIQNLLALSISKNFEEFKKNIVITSYSKENNPDFLLDRYHFTSDYIQKNSNYFENVTGEIIPNNKLSKRKIEINYDNFFKLYNLETKFGAKKMTLSYLQKDEFLKREKLIKKALEKDEFYIALLIPNEEYFQFIKEKINTDIDIHHLGILFLKNNEIYMRHTSSIEKKVTEIFFKNYIKLSKKLEGIMFIKLKDYENNR